ncbi:very short patch repair endonuclease [Nitrosomonas sp. Is37]|uniref:very short patch repair endonuclease n=1 Tax=Nitrosomonas sp. Is37 TaxID=3080535 RepID=UPI00294B082D|nr:very short patch repair endonuclease [Nitrosomonas sp. Is37]MDV6344780.1 very short patch repair endonuclease [Nitrosomonas sp. Is37]
MVDRVDKDTRSRIMAKVQGKNTKPELRLRQALFSLGFRFRLHAKHLPGTPDLTFPRYRVALFVNGCFWHWHGCKHSRLPASNLVYWENKIVKNQLRDRANYEKLLSMGWRVIVVWECSLEKEKINETIRRVEEKIKCKGVQNHDKLIFLL